MSMKTTPSSQTEDNTINCFIKCSYIFFLKNVCTEYIPKLAVKSISETLNKNDLALLCVITYQQCVVWDLSERTLDVNFSSSTSHANIVESQVIAKAIHSSVYQRIVWSLQL